MTGLGQVQPHVLTSDVRGLAVAAMRANAERISMSRFDWNVAGYCEDPVEMVVYGRPDERARRGDAIEIIMRLPCRKCRPCLRARAQLWKERAELEVRASKRTRLVTLTINQAEHEHAWLKRLAQLSARGVDGDTLTPKEQFAERCVAFGPEITKWLKRIRKRSGCSLRYLLVAEAHKSGLPHFHVLLHEVDGAVTLRDLGFRKQDEPSWFLGFGHSKIVYPSKDGGLDGATYVCKYLSKSLAARVRASIGYGAERQISRPLDQVYRGAMARPTGAPYPQSNVKNSTTGKNTNSTGPLAPRVLEGSETDDVSKRA